MTAAIACAALAGAGAAGCRRILPGGTGSGHGLEAAALAQSAPPSDGNNVDITPKTPVPEVAELLSQAFINAATAIRPSVVRIDVELPRRPNEGASQRRQNSVQGPPDMRDFFEKFFDFGERLFPQQGPVHGTGSGVIIDKAGHIVTNSHVIQNAQKVTITLVNGRELAGEVLGTDPETDLGVVRLTSPPRDLTIARLGNADQLHVGQWVLAVGSPLGLDQSVTAGIVSGLGRTGGRVRLSGERVRRYIQTDAAINPGNSGGPLVNLSGEAVGINTLINVGPGGAYGFAIPINQASQVAKVLIRDGRIRYPYIGVRVANVDDLPDEMRAQLGPNAPTKGAFVADVAPTGPAGQGGLQAGDIITKINDRAVQNASDVIDTVSSLTIGSPVSIEFLRAGKPHTIKVTLAELPGEGGAGPAIPKLGLSLQTLTDPLSRSLGIDPALKGAVVTEVQPDSPASRAGLQPGDVIIEVDRKRVISADAAAAALRVDAGRPHLLRVAGGGTRYVTIPPK